MTPQELKHAEVELRDVARRIGEKEGELKQNKFELQKLKDRAEKLKEDIAKASQIGILVSEHAILQYLVRVEKLDLERTKQTLLGNVQGNVPDGLYPQLTHKLRVAGGKVVTVLPLENV